MEPKVKNLQILLDNAYMRYCNSEDNCLFTVCPINSLMLNFGVHIIAKEPMMIYGDYKLLERLGR